MNNQLENIRKWLILGGIAFFTVFVFAVMMINNSPKSDRKLFGQKDQPVDPEIEMILVQGGTFWMGCTAEQGKDCEKEDVPSEVQNEIPVHEVTVSSFYIAKFVITQAQWRAVMGDNPSHFKGDSLPVEQVSWNDTQKFLRRLNSATGKQYRLPTEEEWEFAARGGDKSDGYKYSGSNNVDDVAWYEINSGGSAHPVGTKQPNELGIYDMSGNVWEWCEDIVDYYPGHQYHGISDAPSWKNRRLRGGSWERPSVRSRVSERGGVKPDFRWKAIGFRVALSL